MRWVRGKDHCCRSFILYSHPVLPNNSTYNPSMFRLLVGHRSMWFSKNPIELEYVTWKSFDKRKGSWKRTVDKAGPSTTGVCHNLVAHKPRVLRVLGSAVSRIYPNCRTSTPWIILLLETLHLMLGVKTWNILVSPYQSVVFSIKALPRSC